MSDEGHQLCDDWFPMPEDEPGDELVECPHGIPEGQDCSVCDNYGR